MSDTSTITLPLKQLLDYLDRPDPAPHVINIIYTRDDDSQGTLTITNDRDIIAPPDDTTHIVAKGTQLVTMLIAKPDLPVKHATVAIEGVSMGSMLGQ